MRLKMVRAGKDCKWIIRCIFGPPTFQQEHGLLREATPDMSEMKMKDLISIQLQIKRLGHLTGIVVLKGI